MLKPASEKSWRSLPSKPYVASGPLQEEERVSERGRESRGTTLSTTRGWVTIHPAHPVRSRARDRPKSLKLTRSSQEYRTTSSGSEIDPGVQTKRPGLRARFLEPLSRRSCEPPSQLSSLPLRSPGSSPATSCPSPRTTGSSVTRREGERGAKDRGKAGGGRVESEVGGAPREKNLLVVVGARLLVAEGAGGTDPRIRLERSRHNQNLGGGEEARLRATGRVSTL